MLQLNVKVNVFRIIKTADSLGGWTEVRNVLYNNLPCRINWIRGSEKVFFNKNTWFVDARMYCNIVDIKVTDRVEYNNAMFEIVDVNNPNNTNKYLTIDLRRLQ